MSVTIGDKFVKNWRSLDESKPRSPRAKRRREWREARDEAVKADEELIERKQYGGSRAGVHGV